MLRDAFIGARRADGRLRSARPRYFGRRPRLRSPAGRGAIDLVYRRVLINDIVAREDECRALVDAYDARAVCVANTLRCKIPHKKAFFAVLTDERHAALFIGRRSASSSAGTSRGPRSSRTAGRRATAQRSICSTYLRAQPRAARDQAERRVRRHRRDARLGDRRERAWDEAIDARASRERERGWVAQERIAVRREMFPVCEGDRRRRCATCSSTSRRTCSAGGSPAS